MRIIRLRNQESGLVSIIVAVGFITLIALISTSFALLSRRESRQALDRQLSTQAFYAAESGVSDAVRAIKSGTGNITNCDDASTLNPDAESNILGNGLSYTCVLIDESPDSLVLGEVMDSKVVRVQASSNIGKIRISWQDSTGKKKFAPANHLLPQEQYNIDNQDSYANHTGIMRATVIPVTSNLNRNDLINNSQTLFLYPLGVGTASSPGTYTYTTGQNTQGTFVDGNCNESNIIAPTNLPHYCNVDIRGLNAVNGGSGTNVFYIRLKGIYEPSTVTIQAYSSDGSTDPLDLVDGQAVIDATGKATDVLRRIQVRVPIRTDYVTPNFALESADDICKLIGIVNTTINDGCEPYN